ncbi:MAG: redoxin domain-containing protein [Leptolyngbyaceae cyanobacterium CSU_1_3]|nr:redoxin domain-containing protein [Leptolyngbyaceae cyanobacterium CSU_1_3]
MRQQSASWFGLGLSSLAIAASLVSAVSVKASATPVRPLSAELRSTLIAQANQNVGRSLAKQLQGKPVVVDIYASWCSACRNIAPTLSQLKQQYGDRVHFIVLDVSDKSKANQAESQAKALGLGQFFSANKAQTGMVAIIDPATGNVLTQHRNNANKSAYTSVLNAALAR